MSSPVSKGNYGSLTNLGSVAIGAVGVLYLLSPGVSTYGDVMANLDRAVGVLMLALAVTFFGLRRAIGRVLTKLDNK